MQLKEARAAFAENVARAAAYPAVLSAESSPFADMSASAFRATRLMRTRRAAALAPGGVSAPLIAESPAASWDWRSKAGVVTPVKDQGSLGTCWAFSTAANLEGQRFLKHGVSEDLSVEHLVECDASFDAVSGDADCAEFGGWPPLAFNFLKANGGARRWADMPYCAGQDTNECWPCMPAGYSTTGCGDHSDLYCNASGTLGQGPAALCKASTPGAVVQVVGWLNGMRLPPFLPARLPSRLLTDTLITPCTSWPCLQCPRTRSRLPPRSSSKALCPCSWTPSRYSCTARAFTTLRAPSEAAMPPT